MRATDGSDISTRTKHREYMHRHGLTTVDDFGHDYWRKHTAQREAVASGHDPNRKHDIARALAQLQEKRR
jgi:hypothetical protein